MPASDCAVVFHLYHCECRRADGRLVIDGQRLATSAAAARDRWFYEYDRDPLE